MALVALALLGGCDDPAQRERNRVYLEEQQRKRWDGPCADMSTLLATTAGSPSYYSCPNSRHRMRVQPVTVTSNEEAAALVFCECDRGTDGGST